LSSHIVHILQAYIESFLPKVQLSSHVVHILQDLHCISKCLFILFLVLLLPPLLPPMGDCICCWARVLAMSPYVWKLCIAHPPRIEYESNWSQPWSHHTMVYCIRRKTWKCNVSWEQCINFFVNRIIARAIIFMDFL
jgi:hypothetical protein